MTARRRFPVILALALVLCGPAPVTAQAEIPPTSAVTRLHFLADADIPDGTVLLLTLLATDGYGKADAPIFRIIRDTAALRAAAPMVWVEDDPGAKARLLLLGALFLSFPANGVDDEFARLVYPDGTTRSIFVFHPAMQSGLPPPHDLAGLLDLSEPVYERFDPVTDAAAYAALVARIDSDPNLFTLAPLPPTAPDLTWPLVSDLQFPSLLLPAAEVTNARITAEIARATARFAELFGPPGTSYALFTIHNQDCGAPMVTDLADTPVVVDGQPLLFPAYKSISLTAELHSDPTLIDRIAAAAATFGPDDRIDPGFDAAFADFVTRSLGPVDPADHALNVGCWQTELDAFWPRENVTYVPSYEILPDPAP